MTDNLKEIGGVDVQGPPGRVAKPRKQLKAVMAWQDEAVLKQLKIAALELDTTQQALIGRALNMLFRELGKPEIALTRANTVLDKGT
jgi:hypothetical protein